LVKQYGVREVCFFEDTFMVNRQRVLDFCRLLGERKLNIVWSASANITNIDEDIIGRMKKAGCWLLSCGIETGNDQIMKTLSKPLSLEEIKVKLKLVVKGGIKVRGYFMIGHMHDTPETIRQTIDFSKSLPLFSANYSIFTPVPGSDFYDELSAKGYALAKYELTTYATEGKDEGYVPEGLTKEYLIKMQRKAFIEFFMRPSQIWLYLASIRSGEDVRRFGLMALAAMVLFARMLKGRALRIMKKKEP
jgi:anaerobic magnesium-protoporphyrin IX monomethyl ester cyclase